jgi:hypothetical protein
MDSERINVTETLEMTPTTIFTSICSSCRRSISWKRADKCDYNISFKISKASSIFLEDMRVRDVMSWLCYSVLRMCIVNWLDRN